MYCRRLPRAGLQSFKVMFKAVRTVYHQPLSDYSTKHPPTDTPKTNQLCARIYFQIDALGPEYHTGRGSYIIILFMLHQIKFHHEDNALFGSSVRIFYPRLFIYLLFQP